MSMKKCVQKQDFASSGNIFCINNSDKPGEKVLTMGTLGPSHRGWPLLLTGLEKMTLNDPASGFVYVTSPLISEASALP